MRWLWLLLLVGCASKVRVPQAPLSDWIRGQEKVSWVHLQKNISPTEPKAPGDPVPRPGIVVAALQRKDPDYYFHWVRDSATVIRVASEREATWPSDPPRLHKQLGDFFALSADFQRLHSAFGMGEPRYTVEGQADQLPWSRPQYDGPALRALAAMTYLNAFPQMPAQNKKTVRQVLQRDLDYVARVWNDRGFDIWEELKAENYHTRLVQLAALERAGQYPAVAKKLVSQLDDHWDPTRGFLRSQLAIEKTDGYTKKQSDLDSAVIVAVVESGRETGAHSIMDDRVHGTVSALEDLFRATYPINKDNSLGLAYGRYLGDVYYGGNPWPLITAYYAQFYYRMARIMAGGVAFQVSPKNFKFAAELYPALAKDNGIYKIGSIEHTAIMAACLRKGGQILARIRKHTPDDGQLYEQIDKVSGKPVSSRGIGWAHASLIAAALERNHAANTVPSSKLPGL